MTDERSSGQYEYASPDEGADPGAPLIPNKSLAADTYTEETHQQKNSTHQCVSPGPVRMWSKAWCRIRPILTSSNFWVALATVVIAVTTIVYACIADRQWSEMRNSNDLSRQSLQSVQRAFASFERLGFDRKGQFTEPGKQKYFWVFEPHFTNTGSTPAIDVISHFDLAELPTGPPTEQQFIGNDQVFGSGIMMQKGEGTIGYKIVDDSFILNDWETAPTSPIITKKIIRRRFFWGWVFYRDVFPKTQPHLTEFCQELVGIQLIQPQTTKVGNKPRFSLVFNSCPKHNCVDEYCEDYQNVLKALSTLRK